MTRPARATLWVLGLTAATAAIELLMGRLPFGPDGRFGWLETDIWSSALSQRFADPYSLSHIEHGLLFYGLIWLVARAWPMSTRVVAAFGLESAWEVLENSPVIINRYREATIAQGYFGDSILNSISDIGMMGLGFLLAARLPIWATVAVVLALELGMLVTMRDNLVLNILMLLSPVDAVREWQMGGG